MTDRTDDATVPAWFAALQGHWRLRRCVLGGAGPDGDAAAPGVEARLTGEATLLPAGAGLALHYKERGVLRLRHGGTLQSTRRYVYRCASDGVHHELAIDFDDGPSAGASFVRLPWPALQERHAAQGEDLHLCGADRYYVRYRFEHAAPGAIAETDRRHDVPPGTEAVSWHLLLQRADAATTGEAGVAALPRWHRIVQRTRVRGPKKDYAIVSILDRIDS